MATLFGVCLTTLSIQGPNLMFRERQVLKMKFWISNGNHTSKRGNTGITSTPLSLFLVCQKNVQIQMFRKAKTHTELLANIFQNEMVQGKYKSFILRFHQTFLLFLIPKFFLSKTVPLAFFLFSLFFGFFSATTFVISNLVKLLKCFINNTSKFWGKLYGHEREENQGVFLCSHTVSFLYMLQVQKILKNSSFIFIPLSSFHIPFSFF